MVVIILQPYLKDSNVAVLDFVVKLRCHDYLS